MLSPKHEWLLKSPKTTWLETTWLETTWLDFLPAGTGADIDRDALQLGAALRIFDLDDCHVGADEIRLGLIKRNKAGYFQRQTLLVIGCRDLAALDADGAVGGRGNQADGGQGSGGAVRLRVQIDANLYAFRGRALRRALDRGRRRRCRRRILRESRRRAGERQGLQEEAGNC